MSQVTNYTVENAGGATVRADINNILLAIQSNNSGVSAPSTTYPGMLWLETPASGDYTLKIRDKGNNHWLTVGVVTDPGSDDDMGTRLLQGAASKTYIKRSDGTVLLAEDGSNVATLTNVVLGTGSEPTSTPLLAMAASSTGITRSSGTALLTEDGSNVATLDQLTLGPGSGATNLKMAAVKLTAEGRLERSDGTDILLEGSGVATLDNVTLGSSVVFPAGHPIQTKGDFYTKGSDLTVTTSSERLLSTNLEVALTCKSTSNYLRVSSYLPCFYNNNEATNAINIGFRYSVDDWTTPVDLGVEWIDSYSGYLHNTTTGFMIGVFFETWVAVPSTTALKIQVATKAINGDVLLFANGSATAQTASLIVQEIQT